ncbi:MAG TPA: flagellin [Candidatus Sulfopaludibacter sp.]|jgi:flagellin|nr:flagellin [Candidatus Sulfopaludibacter sp.]
MSLSIQTNVNSLVAQENLSVNSKFQSQTIQRLTSGYRINSSADDAAGLAVANKFRSDTAELSQGVRNANDGISQLQIIDGGLTNISQMLDRLKTLATQSSSTTFTGDRSTLNNEFQSLLGEINRQAADIKLDSTGTFKSKMSVYIGGGNASNSTNSNAQVSVDLSASAVDSQSLGIDKASVLGGGVEFTSNNAKLLSDPGSVYSAAQTFTVNYIDSNGVAQNRTTTYTAGDTGQQAVTDLNNGLDKATGVSAQIGSDGQLQFVGSGSFTVSVTANANGVVNSAGGGTMTLVNTGNHYVNSNAAWTDYAVGSGSTSNSDVLTFTDAKTNKTATFTLDSTTADSMTNAVNNMNTFFKAQGMSVTALSDGTHVSFQSSGDFSISEAHTDTDVDGTGAIFNAAGAQAASQYNPNSTATGAALSAVDAIAAANKALGLVQGRVGTGENQLSYAINLAQSQITNFSAAQSQIRDADVATEAANLSKAQVLQQASIAAMAQANSAPQAVLSLLRG